MDYLLEELRVVAVPAQVQPDLGVAPDHGQGRAELVGDVREELVVIPGNVPNLIDLPKGCRFAPRCAARLEHDVAIATEVHPNLLPLSTPGQASPHEVRCWLYHDAAGNLSDLGREASAGRVGADRARAGADPLAGAGQ